MTEHGSPQQLTLLPESPAAPVPDRFRLDEATRRLGLHHVTEIRRHLAERQADRAGDTMTRRLERPQAA